MRQREKERRRFGPAALAVTAATTFLITLAAVVLAAWLFIGPDGLTLLSGFGVIRTQFVGEYDQEEGIDMALSGLVAGTGDRWSYYLNRERYASERERRENIYVGIGVTVDYSREEGVTIQSVTPGGPAEAAGLKAGEVITAVDGVSIAGDARQEAVERIQGKEGTQVVLSLLAPDGSRREVTVCRGRIETDPVAYELLDGGVGYIQVKNFFRRSAEQVEAAAQALRDQGATALIFDMRNNSGGYLDELIPMLDALLPEGPIFRTRSNRGKEEVYQSDDRCVDLPMAVLVNESTYSAAEIFAAELRERGAAVIVGVPTSGKGYSQQIFPLPNGGALGISTAEYFTGEGTSLVGTGLTLDQEIALSEEDDAQQKAGTLPKEKDWQLQAALALLNPDAKV
ncbi:S41 family peptidase [Pseudoflavonifractor sp. 524-17]|uniref:S41 family peptidase n=1 Tax=Pseudoflavonifractor sp. 524-17 TaxID=2304577 RepID=UPI00137B1801|nr:S41 family peptidase [Pseudoflavonifractor sp. 524-17]NCE63332.1 S41 family peptidase [Pseudoflavonifractor sp. 524-17]